MSHPNNREGRAAHKARMVERVKRNLPTVPTPERWADNRAKCSCGHCQSDRIEGQGPPRWERKAPKIEQPGGGGAHG